MKTETQSVKSKIAGVSKDIGEAIFPVYDSVDEAISEEGSEKCCDFINAQVRTNEMNRVRALARGGPSKNKLRVMAISEISPEEWQAIAGDIAAIETKLQEKIKEIEARMDSAPAEPVAVGVDDEEDL